MSSIKQVYVANQVEDSFPVEKPDFPSNDESSLPERHPKSNTPGGKGPKGNEGNERSGDSVQNSSPGSEHKSDG